jgi:hypothetical protein
MADVSSTEGVAALSGRSAPRAEAITSSSSFDTRSSGRRLRSERQRMIAPSSEESKSVAIE